MPPSLFMVGQGGCQHFVVAGFFAAPYNSSLHAGVRSPIVVFALRAASILTDWAKPVCFACSLDFTVVGGIAGGHFTALASLFPARDSSQRLDQM